MVNPIHSRNVFVTLKWLVITDNRYKKKSCFTSLYPFCIFLKKKYGLCCFLMTHLQLNLLHNQNCLVCSHTYIDTNTTTIPLANFDMSLPINLKNRTFLGWKNPSTYWSDVLQHWLVILCSMFMASAASAFSWLHPHVSHIVIFVLCVIMLWTANF